MAAAKVATKRLRIPKEHELRIEVGNTPVYVKLERGLAEVFGAELSLNREFSLKNCNVAIFSWHGCEISVRGTPVTMYTSEDTPLAMFINVHALLESMRKTAEAKGAKGSGPRVLVLGPTDSGKSVLCRILLNYAVRSGRVPTFVDLDVGQNEVSIPGAIAATAVEHVTEADAVLGLRLKAPLAYYFGHATPQKSLPLFKKFVENLAARVEERGVKNAAARCSGTIINTCGWVENEGYALQLHSARAFNVDIIIVLGDERLHNKLSSDEDCKAVLWKVARSGGVVQRSSEHRRKTRGDRIREYFYGPNNSLCPHQKIVSLRDLQVYRVGSAVHAPSGTLPLGSKPMLDPNRFMRVQPSVELRNEVFALSFAQKESDLATANVAGFVFVSHVDMKKGTVTLLVPAPGQLPGRFFLMGSIKWLNV